MKKSFGLLVGAALIAISGQVAANSQEEIGKKIYDRAFGRGCSSCHDVKSNPQLAELIQAGKLPKDQFEKVVREGKNGMPKAIEAIMEVGPVKKAGLTEAEAIDAVYMYLSK